MERNMFNVQGLQQRELMLLYQKAAKSSLFLRALAATAKLVWKKGDIVCLPTRIC